MRVAPANGVRCAVATAVRLRHRVQAALTRWGNSGHQEEDRRRAVTSPLRFVRRWRARRSVPSNSIASACWWTASSVRPLPRVEKKPLPARGRTLYRNSAPPLYRDDVPHAGPALGSYYYTGLVDVISGYRPTMR